jgi:hypothetical protein
MSRDTLLFTISLIWIALVVLVLLWVLVAH